MMAVIVFLIPLFPLLGFLVLGLGYKSVPRKVAAFIGPGSVLLSFISSLVVVAEFRYLATSLPRFFLPWIHVGSLDIPFAFLVDPLSSIMLLVVTGVGFIIHVYSVGYMKEDPGFNRFFAYMNLFVFSMLLLVLGANYPVMFIGWEGVGLCSYLLIGFWFKNHDYNNAAKKAFIMNRIGDLGFLLGMFLIFNTFGSLSFDKVFEAAKSVSIGDPVVVAITLLLFIGAVGKSAQIPLYTWLPDAMAGPTPVSALIHAATMVTAGVYMVARSNILYALSPVTLTVIGVTGLMTALFAASIAIFQNDIKKVLAYSTISQLGYMFAGLGAGAFTGAIFHLTTHAFFKALLFLGAGSVIHAMGGEQDIRNMGGLRGKLPKTYWTFLLGTIAIAGIPPMSGFFSKDEILLHLFEHAPWMWGIAVAGALMTAFYMFRLLYLTFFRNFRGTDNQQSHLHESPQVMVVPLIMLAILATAGGFLNIPALMGGGSFLTRFLEPVFADAAAIVAAPAPVSHATEWMLMGTTLAGCLLMIAWAWNRYVKQGKGLAPDTLQRSFNERLLVHKYYIDEIYDLLISRPILALSRFFHDIIEVRIIDRIVNGLGNVVIWTGNTLRFIQTGNVGFYMFIMILGIILILFFNILI